MDKNREADREGKKAKRTRATSARMLGYLQQQRGTLISLTLLVLTGSVLTLLAPYLLGLAVDEYILLHNVNGMIRVCILLLIIYVTASLVSWLQNHLMAAVSSRVVWKLREELFGRLSRLPLRFFDRSKHGDLMSRTTNDMENISNTLNQTLLQAITSTIMLIGSFGMMLYLNIWLTLVAMVTIPVVLFVIRRIVKQTKFHFAQQQKRLGTLNGYMEEMITGQKAVKLYHREQRESEQFAVQNEELTRAGIRAQILSGFVGPTMNMTNHLNFMLIAVAGAWMAVNEWVTVGIVVSFLNYSRQFSGPLNQLANQYNMIQSGIAGAERVFEIIDTPTEFDEETPLRQADFKHGRVDFDKVDFAYDVNPILRQVSFTAEPGQTIALVGPTGAGKTTIINMLTRFYEISGGSIRIDGTDIRSYDKESLRSRLGIVLQDAHLFSGTVLDNIRYGRLKATEEEVMAAAKLANADAMIASCRRVIRRNCLQKAAISVRDRDSLSPLQGRSWPIPPYSFLTKRLAASIHGQRCRFRRDFGF